ncbi:hypothetical protein FB451DRAFT_1420825 [Mycena latifolia]|nr:hypothetical protein FB451DRAFT_1420825 [Mycena latifolia]
MSSSTNNSHVYSTLRLRSFHGFDASPILDDGLDFRLPQGAFHNRLEVYWKDKRYHVWSPNSLQAPYYPGRRPRSSLPCRAHAKDQRRFDGSLGRYDHTVAPQYYEASRPWWPFIEIHRPPVDADGVIDPAHEEVHARLIESNSDLDAAVFNSSRIYHSRMELWRDCPLTPSKVAIEGLRVIRAYELAVDEVCEVQRGMLEKRAWLEMVRRWFKDQRSTEQMREMPIVPADDRFLGVWLHGATEEDMLFYLMWAEVPCFLIHELRGDEPVGERVVYSFMQETPFHFYLDPYNYEYDRLAFIANNGRYTGREIGMPPLRMPERSQEERRGSSLRWQLGLPSSAPLPAASASRSNSADDEDGVSLGPASESETPSQVARPPPVPMQTFLEMESAVVTAILKFPDLSISFTSEDMEAWLTAAHQVAPVLGADYVVEFVNPEAALRTRGLINGKEGQLLTPVDATSERNPLLLLLSLSLPCPLMLLLPHLQCVLDLPDLRPPHLAEIQLAMCLILILGNDGRAHLDGVQARCCRKLRPRAWREDRSRCRCLIAIAGARLPRFIEYLSLSDEDPGRDRGADTYDERVHRAPGRTALDPLEISWVIEFSVPAQARTISLMLSVTTPEETSPPPSRGTSPMVVDPRTATLPSLLSRLRDEDEVTEP